MVLMFLPAMALGLAFPAVCEVVVGSGGDHKTSSARVYFWGTVGSAVGALVVGFWIIPHLGILGSLTLLILVQLALCLWVLSEAHIRVKALPFLALATGFAAVVWSFRGPPYVGHGGLVRQNSGWIEKTPSGGQVRILAYQSGRSATVIAKEAMGESARQPYRTVYGPSGEIGLGLGLPPRQEPYRTLYVDDQPVASTIPDSAVDSKMLAHIPLMLHPNPRRALTVGFGSGGTSWSMSLYGIETHAVEIEPVVLQMAKYFESQNHGVLSRSNVRAFLNDARDHLHVSRLKYDVISTDVTNLRYKQNASLYTREYFQLMRDRLNKDGVACAWIPMLGIPEEQLKILMRTFQSVYPHASLWYMDQMNTSFGILVGTAEPTRFSMKRLNEVMQKTEIVDDLKSIYIENAYEAIQFMMLDEDGYRNYAGTGPLHTDDRPILEFTSPSASLLGFQDLAPILEHIYAAPRKPITTFLKDASESETLFAAKYERFARLRSEMNRLIVQAAVEPNPATRTGILSRAQVAGEDALRMFPQRDELAVVVDWLHSCIHPD